MAHGKSPIQQTIKKPGTTPIKLCNMHLYLSLYPKTLDASELRDGFKYGFKINYFGPRFSSTCDNLISTKQHPDEVRQKIYKEIELGRVAGPFDQVPMHNFRLSPIGIVAKKDGGWRLIHHLSFPEGSSVNDFIDPDYCTVHYTPFDEVLEMIANLGTDSFLAKMDVKSAFRLLPVHPADQELLGFKFNNQFYYDMCLPMGCSISCALWEKFASFLEWVTITKTGKDTLGHYLDDFIFAAKDIEGCKLLMSSFQNTCRDFGIPLAEEKTVGPKKSLVFLGIEIDTEKMVISIPEDKTIALKHSISQILGKSKITLKILQSLVGTLNFCAKAIPAARAFNRRFCDAMCGIKHPSHFIRVNEGMKSDLRVWLSFLEQFNGSLNFLEINWLSDFDLHLYTDSAGNPQLGCGVYLQGQWAYFQWPHEWQNTDIISDITFLELIPIVLAVMLFKSHFHNKKIMFHTDNIALVAILNKKTSKSKRVMQLVRPLVLYAMINNTYFKSRHISGCNNSIADSISRKQWTRFRSLAPEADVHPLPIPEDFTRMISELK